MVRKKISATATATLLSGDQGDFLNTLIKLGEDEKLDPRSSAFWKRGGMPEYQLAWEVPSSSALILRRGNPPPDWQGPDFIETMEGIYKRVSEQMFVLFKQG